MPPSARNILQPEMSKFLLKNIVGSKIFIKNKSNYFGLYIYIEKACSPYVRPKSNVIKKSALKPNFIGRRLMLCFTHCGTSW